MPAGATSSHLRNPKVPSSCTKSFRPSPTFLHNCFGVSHVKAAVALNVSSSERKDCMMSKLSRMSYYNWTWSRKKSKDLKLSLKNGASYIATCGKINHTTWMNSLVKPSAHICLSTRISGQDRETSMTSLKSGSWPRG